MNFSQNIFNSPQRKRLFQSLKMGWYDVCPIEEGTGIPLSDQTVPYALYHCQTISQQTIQDIREASVTVGKVLNSTWSIIKSFVFSAAVTTFQGTMLLNFMFSEPSISIQRVETLANDVIDYLVNACNQ
jgi:hypothetical protein